MAHPFPLLPWPLRRRAAARPSVRRPFGVLGVLASAVMLVAQAPPAYAHVQLVRSDPAEGSTAAKAPTAVTLSFSGPVIPEFTSVVVTGPDGLPYSDGAARVVGGKVLQNVKARLPSGVVKVSWRTVAEDGAPAQGGFSFTNASGPKPAAASPGQGTGEGSSASEPPAAGQATDGDGRGTEWAWWAAGGVAGLTVLAGGATLLRRRRPGPEQR